MSIALLNGLSTPITAQMRCEMELIREIWIVKNHRKLETPVLTPQDASDIVEVLHAEGSIDSQTIKRVLLDCVMEINELYRTIWKFEDRVASLEQENARLRNAKRRFYRKQN